MKRVIKIQGVLQEEKYVLREEYESFGIYQRMTPNGYYVNQDWMISDNGEHELVVNSFNDICKEELMDMIDGFNSTRKFGVKANRINSVLHMHPSGKLNV